MAGGTRQAKGVGWLGEAESFFGRTNKQLEERSPVVYLKNQRPVWLEPEEL